MTNFRKTNPTVRRYVVRILRDARVGGRSVKSTRYLWEGAEVDDISLATHWSAPSHAYLALEIYGKKLAETDPEERKSVFLDVFDTRPRAMVAA